MVVALSVAELEAVPEADCDAVAVLVAVDDELDVRELLLVMLTVAVVVAELVLVWLLLAVLLLVIVPDGVLLGVAPADKLAEAVSDEVRDSVLVAVMLAVVVAVVDDEDVSLRVAELLPVSEAVELPLIVCDSEIDTVPVCVIVLVELPVGVVEGLAPAERLAVAV